MANDPFPLPLVPLRRSILRRRPAPAAPLALGVGARGGARGGGARGVGKGDDVNIGSFCSGICAPEVAWSPLGWKPRWFAEVDSFASAVEAHRFPDVPNLGDMTAIDPATLPDADLWVAGTPCQAFSVAGLRKSLGDARGNLTLHFVKLIHARNPLAVVWENVPGVLSTKDNAFGYFLAGLVGEGKPLLCGDGSWPDAGMVVGPVRTAAWRVLDAQFFGLAQRRRRVFVVSFRTGDGHNPGTVLFEPESVQRHSAPSREAGTRATTSLTTGFGSRGADDNAGQAGWLIPDTFCMAHGQAGAEVVRDGSPSLTCNHEAPIITHTLRGDGFDASEDGTGRGTPLIPVAVQEDNQNGVTVRDTAGSLRSDAPGTQPCGTQTTLGYDPDTQVCGTIQADQTVAVAFQTRIARNGRGQPEEICPTLQGASAGATSDMRPMVATTMAVRRLTPRECERLQGFPDDYTLIPYRGKAAADGSRYRALGNSMAVPVLRWIGERIAKVLTARSEVA